MADKKETATYISRYLQLRIVRKPAYSREVDGQRVSTPGTSIQFEQGVFTTSDPDEIAFIEARPEFGKLIQKVPKNIKDIDAERTEQFQSLEEREAAVAAREAAIAEKEASLKGTENGRSEGGSVGDEEDGLEALSKADLLAIVEEEEVPGVNSRTTIPNLIAAIREHREAGDEDEEAFEE